MIKTKIFSLDRQLFIWLGLAQGIALYALYKTHQEAVWPEGSGYLFNALLLSALLLPFVVYWGQDVLGKRAMRGLLVVMGLAVLGLGAYQGMTVFPLPEFDKPRLADFPAFAGLALVSFMLVPLVSAWGKKGSPDLALGRWDYALLFEHSWRNAVITVQAGVLACLFWIVLELGAQLFSLIGIDWPKKTIEKSWFAIPVTTLSVALGIRAGLRRSAFTGTLRNHWLTLTAWLLPIVSLIGAAFTLTSLAGVDKLFERGLSAFFLLWFAAFWVKFFNSAFQDGKSEPPFGRWLKHVLPYTAIGLLVVAGMAAWALLLRIEQHGLTPDRIWGAFVAIVALCYGVGYPLSLASRSGWMRHIAGANVFAALVMCAGILLLLSPVLDARRLSTGSQLERLHGGEVKADDFDVFALTQQGSHGHQALAELARQQDAQGNPTRMAFRAKEAMEYTRQYRFLEEGSDKKETLIADLQSRLDGYPMGKPLPEGFLDFLGQDIGKWENWQRQQSCFDQRNKNSRCSLLQVDLNNDGMDEIVLWQTINDYEPRVYSRADGKWRHAGFLQRIGGGGRQESIQAELYAGEFEARPPGWNELHIGKAQFQVREKTEISED